MSGAVEFLARVSAVAVAQPVPALAGALSDVLTLHRPGGALWGDACAECASYYPCPTVRKIEERLK